MKDITKKAQELSSNTNFKASPGWFQNFLKE